MSLFCLSLWQDYHIQNDFIPLKRTLESDAAHHQNQDMLIKHIFRQKNAHHQGWARTGCGNNPEKTTGQAWGQACRKNLSQRRAWKRAASKQGTEKLVDFLFNLRHRAGIALTQHSKQAVPVGHLVQVAFGQTLPALLHQTAQSRRNRAGSHHYRPPVRQQPAAAAAYPPT